MLRRFHFEVKEICAESTDACGLHPWVFQVSGLDPWWTMFAKARRGQRWWLVLAPRGTVLVATLLCPLATALGRRLISHDTDMLGRCNQALCNV